MRRNRRPRRKEGPHLGAEATPRDRASRCPCQLWAETGRPLETELVTSVHQVRGSPLPRRRAEPQLRKNPN